jgi:hypothetical protein
MSFLVTTRCGSTLQYKKRLEDGSFIFTPLNCELGLSWGEEHSHRCYLPTSRLFVTWTTQQADESAWEMQKELIEKHTSYSTKSLIGWRVWELAHNDRLLSITAGVSWDGPVMRTDKNRRPVIRELGFIGGDWGIYCYKTPNLALKYLGTNYPIIGAISLSGTVIEHELGYRAQIATVRELWVTLGWPKTISLLQKISLLQEIYECPVHSIDTAKLPGWAKYYTNLVANGEY